ncbi:MAG: MmcB family DNA repair protein [Pseudomonadota bacterium]
MPLVSAAQPNHPLIDGRQSHRAMQIRRGVQVLLGEQGFAVLPEMVLATGRRADLVGLGPQGAIWIVEIKSSIQDFQVDQKWPEYRDYCDCFTFATLPDVPTAIFPPDEGLLVADQYGGDVIRAPNELPLNAARRKAITLRFARAAAQKLMAAEWAADSTSD